MSADANAPQLLDKPDVVPHQCRDFPSRDRNGAHLGEREDTSESLKKGEGR